MTERDIKARLRDEVLLYPGKHAVVTQELLQSALAAIEALEAERDRLREFYEAQIAFDEEHEDVDYRRWCEVVERLGRAQEALTPPGAPAEETGQAQHGNGRCVCGHLSSEHACDHEAGDDSCGVCGCEAFAIPRVGPPAAEGARPGYTVDDFVRDLGDRAKLPLELPPCPVCGGSGKLATPSARLDEIAATWESMAVSSPPVVANLLRTCAMQVRRALDAAREAQ